MDSFCLTGESNDGNNQTTLAYTVGGADFVVTSLSAGLTSPKAKTTFSATVVVKNQGTLSADGGYVDVWANQPSIQTYPADGDNSAVVGVLGPGASKSIVISGLPAGTAGTKTLRAFVDSYCQTPETSDANNQTAAAYSVVP